jgi:heme A synthase
MPIFQTAFLAFNRFRRQKGSLVTNRTKWAERRVSLDLSDKVFIIGVGLYSAVIGASMLTLELTTPPDGGGIVLGALGAAVLFGAALMILIGIFGIVLAFWPIKDEPSNHDSSY